MMSKITVLLLAAALVYQVSCRNVDSAQGFNDITEVRLPDRTVNYLTNPLIGTAISIPQLPLDTLEACTVDFPNGLTYEVFPESNLPSTVTTSNSVFRSCEVHFRGVSTSLSGTYELAAIISHFDGRRTMQLQRFVVNISEISN